MINNYHTHTFLCDGVGEPEEYVLQALKLGCSEIGFSGHSYAPWDKTCLGMDSESFLRYRDLIYKCKNKYRDIKIYCGLELDYYSQVETDGLDFIIGAVHYVKKQNTYIPVDYSVEVLKKEISELYNGDFYAFAKDYFNLVADLYNKTKCDIIAHFDLITKLNKNGILFNQSEPIYQKSALNAVNSLAKLPCVIEVNTGGIARGYKSSFYPDEFVLDEFARLGKSFVLASDCHNSKNLNFGLKEARDFLDKKGYKIVNTLSQIKNNK